MGRKLLLEKAHVEGIRYFDTYRREGGYRSVEKALKTMGPDDVTEEVKNRDSGAVAAQASLPV
ncbi:hypothetical protein LWM68_37855 [Niabella sp. W65]|nr:hypothetical protein [Niabella sp. W65]MCH7368004.1 hypothetical protein [Niabella sp. W65]